MRDAESGNSKGFAFVNYGSFEASDAAIEAMNGQYLCNRPISVSYAFKKDSKGERHGSAAERYANQFRFVFVSFIAQRLRTSTYLFQVACCSEPTDTDRSSESVIC